MVDFNDIQRIAEIEYGDIVECTEKIDHKLRILLQEGNFIDVYLTEEIKDRFGFHWERKAVNRQLFRYDNYPDPKWKRISSFPYHFHNGSQEKVETSPFSSELPQAFRDFMSFVRKRISETK